MRGHRHANSKRTAERGTKTKPFPSKEISAPGAARNRDCPDTEMNFYKWRWGWKTRRGHSLLAPGFLENRLSRYTCPAAEEATAHLLPSRVFPHPPPLSQSALLLHHIKANLFKATVQNCVSNPRPKPNPSSLREFRPAGFWTDGIKGAGNRKVQVVGRGTGGRESQSEFQCDDFYCCITSWVDVQVLESLGLYQTCVFKYKDFHLCAEIGSLLHSLDLDIRILISTSDFFYFFFLKITALFRERQINLSMKSYQTYEIFNYLRKRYPNLVSTTKNTASQTWVSEHRKCNLGLLWTKGMAEMRFQLEKQQLQSWRQYRNTCMHRDCQPAGNSQFGTSLL